MTRGSRARTLATLSLAAALGLVACGNAATQGQSQTQEATQETASFEPTTESQGIGLVGVGNARELGGYAGDGDRAVRHGVLLRTAALAEATDADVARLTGDYNLATVVDLRMTSEAEQAPDPEIDGVAEVEARIIDEEAMAERQRNMTAEDTEGLDLTNKMDQLRLAMRLGIVSDHMYVDWLSSDVGKQGYATLFQELLDLPEGSSLLFHCTQGKDRTGLAAALVLSALGVDRQAILADYELTNEFNAQLIEGEREQLEAAGLEGDELDAAMMAMDEVDPQTLANALDWMDESYGSAVDYITQELGVTDGQLEALRDKFLE